MTIATRLSLLGALGLALAGLLPASAAERPDPAITIPRAVTTPVVDGKLGLEEYKYAATITMLEAYPSYWPQAVRQEQPVYYLCWDDQYLYVAMDALDSNTNTIVASCAEHDNMRIIGDDVLEMMLAPGAGEEVKRYDFPTFYMAVNALGTIWDCRFVTQLNEVHNSWESGLTTASSVDGTRWICELRVPFSTIALQSPKSGTTWRLNLDRTYSGYSWSAWDTRGGLNDCRVGGNLTFAADAAAVRLLACDPVLAGKLELRGEVANPTATPQTVTLRLACEGRVSLGDAAAPIGKAEKTMTLAPGKVEEFVLGAKERLGFYNRLTFTATDPSGRVLYDLERNVELPAPRFVKRPAPEVPLVYLFPRFLPSVERLATLVDFTAWARKTSWTGAAPKAELQVFPKGKEAGAPVLSGVLKDFSGTRGTLRQSTAKLPEGEYVVKVKVTAADGKVIADYDDWFEKRIFDWMKAPRGVGEKVPAPYTPLGVSGREISPWGRTYRLSEQGLLTGLASSGKELLAGASALSCTIGGKEVPLKVVKPFAVTSATPGLVTGQAILAAGDVRFTLDARMEYDGFLLYRITYEPTRRSAGIQRLRLRVPLDARYCKFYSASGDTQGTNIQADVLPDRQGLVFDSLHNTRSVGCQPTFATCLWVGDYETCFCYAADTDKGWLLRDDAPAVELHREGEQFTMYLNLVDRETLLQGPRTAEFSLQAGPLRPNFDNFRGMQDGGYPGDAPLTILQTGGGGYTLAGGSNFLHPGETPEQRKASREIIAKLLAGPGEKAVVGYHYYATVPKGLAATRVFRGEWGLDKRTWDNATQVQEYHWQQRYYGENRDNYILMYVTPVPSYVDFCAYSYDESLKETALAGHYDDTGYPRPVYDEELGYGYLREDGRKVYSSGLWLYRERWKREAYVNFLHDRPNYLRDSQHVHAHYLPAYGPIGIWAPCEHGYYNPFTDRDNYDFYGSLEKYAAYNPARQVGQPAMVGMASYQWAAPLFARDTRSMMMLTFLHDQDVGCFGARDTRTVQGARHARSLFRPWEKDVSFVGYWRSAEVLQAEPAAVKVSTYTAPGRALFLVGNTGEAGTATVRPDWAALKLNPAGLGLFNAETGQELARQADGGFTIPVPRHDVRLVLAGKPGSFALPDPVLGRELPPPAQVLPELSDPLSGTELGPAWEQDLHENHAGAWMLDGRLGVQGNHYGFAHVRRKLGVDNVTAQALILTPPTGGSDLGCGALSLVWENGAYVQALPGMGTGKFLYVVSGSGQRWGQKISDAYVPGWWPNAANWVKVALRPDLLVFYSSADGKTWVPDVEVPRDAAHAGAPQWLQLGNGWPGDQPHLDNVFKQHFNPDHGGQMFFSDLVVGKEN